jgi:hypothetical protein
MNRTVARAVVLALAVGACTPPATAPSPSVTVGSPSPAASALIPTAAPATPAPTASLAPTELPQAMTGVLDVRPEGWSHLDVVLPVDDFPGYLAQVYGPSGDTEPPFEGPGRIVLYEVFEETNPYLEYRIGQSEANGGQPVDVTVNGQPAEVWVDGDSGELVLGWTHRGKSDVLVANTADYSIQELVASAEGLGECCG